MSLLELHMCLFGWFYKWRTRRDTLNKLKVRTREEVLLKKKEFEQKLLSTEKQDSPDRLKYKFYMDVIKWVLKET